MNNNIVPFLMKILLKIEVCGTRKQCTDTMFTFDKSKHAAEKIKKTKKGKKRNVDPQTQIQTDT